MALIEAHGIVVPTNVTGDRPIDAAGWRECWRHRVNDPGSNHKRVPMSGGPALPHAPRVLSTNPDSARRRGQLQAVRRANRLEGLEHRYREELAKKSHYLQRVKRGLEARLPLEDYREWAAEVRQLGLRR